MKILDFLKLLNDYVGFITLLVGSVAIWTYNKQKQDDTERNWWLKRKNKKEHSEETWLAMKIVLDTNILISALGWRGKPNEIFRKVINGELELIISKKQ